MSELSPREVVERAVARLGPHSFDVTHHAAGTVSAPGEHIEIRWTDGPNSRSVGRVLATSEGIERRGRRSLPHALDVPVYLEREVSPSGAARALVRAWHEGSWDGALYWDDDWAEVLKSLAPDADRWEWTRTEEVAAQLLLDRGASMSPGEPKHLLGVLARHLFETDPQELWDVAAAATGEDSA